MSHTPYLTQEEFVKYLRSFEELSGKDLKDSEWGEYYDLGEADVHERMIAAGYAASLPLNIAALPEVDTGILKRWMKYACAKAGLDRKLFAFNRENRVTFLEQYKDLMSRIEEGTAYLPSLTGAEVALVGEFDALTLDENGEETA